MKTITREEYDQLMAFMKSPILTLLAHEDDYREKNGGDLLTYTQTGFPITNISFHRLDDETCFYLVCSNTMLNVVTELLPRAQKEHPNLFGTGSAYDVLEALYKVSDPNAFISKDRYIDFMEHRPCYVIYKHNGTFEQDILRIDTFRDIKKKTGNNEFQGGLFHTLKHFSMNGVNLSTGNDNKTSVFDVYHVLYLIAKAFHEKKYEKGSNYVRVQKSEGNSHLLKYIFYKEEISGVFFLDSCHIVPKSKAN